jgi:hypothetical protein
MNKILLISLVAILAMALSACAPGVALSSDSEKVTNVASEIADFDVPVGYAAEFTASLAGYTMVAYNPGDGHSHLYLVQSENEADSEELEKMLTEMAPGSSDRNTRMTVAENRPATIREKDATLVISDGINHDGDAYRQVTVSFQGKGGPALLVLSEPTDRWDQSTVDALIASIK